MSPALQAAADATLSVRPNILVAEIRFIAERDHRSLFSAALEQWARDRAEPEQERLL